MAAPTQTNTVTAQFHKQLDADWNYWISQYPEFATQLGRTEYDARWTDYTTKAIDARAGYLRTSAKKLSAIDRQGLNAADQVSYDLYHELLETALQGLDLHYDALPIRSVVPAHLLMPVNQLGGIQQDVPRTVAIMRHETVKDYETIIARLEAVSPLVDQTIALMERGLAAGITQPRVVMRGVPDQVQGQLVSDPGASPLLDAFDGFPASISQPDRDRLTAAARAVYSKHVAPAFTRLKDFIEKTYLPKCREEIAITAIPNGDTLYRYNVRWHTTTELTPKEIHQIGLDEVKRIRGEMDKVIASSGLVENKAVAAICCEQCWINFDNCLNNCNDDPGCNAGCNSTVQHCLQFCNSGC